MILFLALLPLLSHAAGPCAEEAHSLIDGIFADVDRIRMATERGYDPVPDLPPRVRPDGKYETRRGPIVSPECLGATDEERAKNRGRWERAVEAMVADVERCGRRRALSSAEALFRSALARRPLLTCDPSQCSAGAAACRLGGRAIINFKREDSYFSSSTLFHELLHLGGADNQTTAHHNQHDDESDLTDEVVFWERHCFSPDVILDRMRGGQPNACGAALAHMDPGVAGPGAPRARYNAREVGIACRQYRDYLVSERNYLRVLNQELIPQAFACTPALEAGCPDVAALNAKLRTRPELAGLQLPTPETASAWIQSHCTASAGASDLHACFALYRRQLDGADDMLAVLGDGHPLSADEQSAVHRLLDRLERKVRFVSRGPGCTEIFPVKGQIRDDVLVVESTRQCMAEDGLRGTSLCRVFEGSVRRPMAALTRYWW